VTMKAAAALRYSLDPSVCRSFEAIEFNLWNRRRNRFTYPGTILHTVCRPAFDNRLVKENLFRPDFTFMEGRRVTAVEYDRRFVVRTDAGPVTGTQLIGADGAYSIVNRRFRIAAPRALATAVEINIPHSAAATAADTVPCLDYGAIQHGYGWVFPKDDHWSVGLYTLSPRTRDIRQQLSAYIRSKSLPRADRLDGLEAFRIPVGGFRLRTPASRSTWSAMPADSPTPSQAKASTTHSRAAGWPEKSLSALPPGKTVTTRTIAGCGARC